MAISILESRQAVTQVEALLAVATDLTIDRTALEADAAFTAIISVAGDRTALIDARDGKEWATVGTDVQYRSGHGIEFTGSAVIA